jgi:glycosyltransferase involved in cell wall biosynthesis
MKILFIVPYPLEKAPSQRFRFEHFFGMLNASGHDYSVSSFIDEKTWSILYKSGHGWQKFKGLMRGYMRRFYDILRLRKYDCIFIHREESPFGLPLLLWIAKSLLRKKVIFDFDDAIWIPNSSEHNAFVLMLKGHKNTSVFCRYASVVTAGNDYLCEYARQYGRKVVYLPTVVDTEHHHRLRATKKSGPFVIGWTGSHSTVQYLDELYPILLELSEKEDFEFHVVSDKEPNFVLPCMKFILWDAATEINSLQSFDIGLMPLPDDKWARGKCGFKALQYMALGIPALVSPVGVNTTIVDHGLNGFICSTSDDWKQNILLLMHDPALLAKMSGETREKVIRHYSVEAVRETFLSLFSS